MHIQTALNKLRRYQYIFFKKEHMKLRGKMHEGYRKGIRGERKGNGLYLSTLQVFIKN